MLANYHSFLGKRVDNAPLIFFRICFGILATAESWGAIMTGWVKRILIDPKFTFSFIDFPWLQPLPGNGMYYYFGIMGLAGVCIMLGYRYRLAAFTFFIMWSGVYLMQKSAYNNHYYFLMLMSGGMSLVPAHKSFSLDVKHGRVAEERECYQLYHLFFMISMMIVYFYGGVNKIYMDWLEARPIGIWFDMKKDYWLIGPFLTNRWLHYFVSYAGIAFDLFIGFALLYKPTRNAAFIGSVFFHLFNSAVFQVGIFPYFSLAFTVFFYPPEVTRKLFFRKIPHVPTTFRHMPAIYTWLFSAYFIVQLLLPLRHHLYEGDVFWTEEGHRLSWRMMLRAKGGTVSFVVNDKITGDQERIKLEDYLTEKQRSVIAIRPDMIWQLAQHIKKDYASRGRDVSVHARARVTLNRKKTFSTIDPDVDLAATPWTPFRHAEWILYPKDD